MRCLLLSAGSLFLRWKCQNSISLSKHLSKGQCHTVCTAFCLLPEERLLKSFKFWTYPKAPRDSPGTTVSSKNTKNSHTNIYIKEGRHCMFRWVAEWGGCSSVICVCFVVSIETSLHNTNAVETSPGEALTQQLWKDSGRRTLGNMRQNKLTCLLIHGLLTRYIQLSPFGAYI